MDEFIEMKEVFDTKKESYTKLEKLEST